MVFNMDSLAREAARGSASTFGSRSSRRVNKYAKARRSSHLGWAEGIRMFWRLPPLPLYWSHLLSTKHSELTWQVYNNRATATQSQKYNREQQRRDAFRPFIMSGLLTVKYVAVTGVIVGYRTWYVYLCLVFRFCIYLRSGHVFNEQNKKCQQGLQPTMI